MAVLLLAEINDGETGDGRNGQGCDSGAQRRLATSMFCDGCRPARMQRQQAATIKGVAKVLCAEDALYGKRLAEPVADLIVSLAGDYDHIVAPARRTPRTSCPALRPCWTSWFISDVTAVV